MKTIDFVVRDETGVVKRDVVADGSRSHIIQVISGQEISLNLRQTDFLSHQRTENDLVMTLADGSVITIENYFNDAGAPNLLYISSDGYLNEVGFIEGEGGTLIAQYGPTEQWGKWSPSDDLIYLGHNDMSSINDGMFGNHADEMSMLAAPFFGPGLVGGVVAVAAGGGGITTTAPPFVNDANSSTTVGGDDVVKSVTVTGGGEPGSDVTVTIGGKTVETDIGEDGTFEVVFDGDNFPDDGSYDAVVDVTTDDNGTTLDGPTFVIDTTAPTTTVTEGTKSASDFFNAETFEQGVKIEGQGEAGSTVAITVGGVTQVTTVGDDGAWSVIYENGTLAGGEYEQEVTIKSTDQHGNSTTTTDTLVVDTLAPSVAITSGAQSTGDSYNADSFGGVTVSGTGEPGAKVELTIDTYTRTATVGDNGTWSVTWQSGVLPAGEYVKDITVKTTDSYGNATTTVEKLVVDTVSEVSVSQETVAGDGMVNGAERAEGVTLTGTTQPGSSVDVTFGSATHPATVDANGDWTVDFAANEIPMGESTGTVIAVATDSFGNTSTAQGEVSIDTLVNRLSFGNQAGGFDATINGPEADDGIVMTGKVEAGSSVVVRLGNASRDATVDSDGNWTVTFASGDIPAGIYATSVTATATDAAGNTRTISQSVAVDTEAGLLTINSDTIEGDDVVNFAERSDGVVISGTADAGALVEVSLAGVTHSVHADGNGNWTSFYAAGEVAQGVYTAQITATTTDVAGNTRFEQDSVQVDTRVDNLTLNAVEGDDIVSGAERLANGGVLVTGTTEIGSTVVISLGNATAPGTVDANGNWSMTFAPAEVPQGTETLSVKVDATDRAGNTATASHQVLIDTVVDPLDMAQAGGSDGIVSAREAAVGIDLNGQVEAGSSVTVTFDGRAYAADVDGNGTWSVTVPGSDIRRGTYDAEISVAATDHAGNMASISDTLAIDTYAPDGPVIASYTRDGDGIRGISTEISPDQLDVHQVNPDRSISEVEASSFNIDQIGERNFLFTTDVPDGSDLIVTATDAAGNSSGTYLALDDESANTQLGLTNPNLAQFNIETVDLQFAEEAQLTITEAALVNLSSNTNTLVINGHSDDTVTITGATRDGSEVKDGHTYDIYTLGAESTLMIDDDINVVI